jgi:hypothetical protein
MFFASGMSLIILKIFRLLASGGSIDLHPVPRENLQTHSSHDAGSRDVLVELPTLDQG